MSFWKQAGGILSGGLAGGLFSSDEVKDFIPGVGDARAQEKANSANKEQAQKQMDFQERMSNSAYQRSMEDMKKAGLNPMLAISQGGASTPSGASAQIAPAAKTGLAEFAMNAATGISTQRNQITQVQNQLQDSIQNRQLQATQSAKNIADTERAQVETIKAKKDVPKAEMINKYSKKAAGLVDNIYENMSNSAKKAKALIHDFGKSSSPKPVKGLRKPLH